MEIPYHISDTYLEKYTVFAFVRKFVVFIRANTQTSLWALTKSLATSWVEIPNLFWLQSIKEYVLGYQELSVTNLSWPHYRDIGEVFHVSV